MESNNLSIFCLFLVGFQGNSSFCLGEEEEVEIEVQEDFLSFEADLVAEQLTYMDAVRGGRRNGKIAQLYDAFPLKYPSSYSWNIQRPPLSMALNQIMFLIPHNQKNSEIF